MSRLPRPLRHRVVNQLNRLITLRDLAEQGPLTRVEREELDALEAAADARARWIPEQLEKAKAKVRALSQRQWRTALQLEEARKRVAQLKAKQDLRP